MSPRTLVLLGALALAGPAAGQTVGYAPLFGHDTDAVDGFGADVDLAGDVALVLAPRQGPVAGGAAYVFRRDPATDTWAEEAQFFPPPNRVFGGSVSLLPGPPGTPERMQALIGVAGVTDLFERTASGAWVYRREFSAPGPGRLVRDASGAEYAVAVRADGTIHVWRRPAGATGPGDWVETVLTPAGGISQGALAVWASPDGAVSVAAPDAGPRPYEVVVLRRDPSGAWSETARLRGSASEPAHDFGEGVAGAAGPGGDVLAVGATFRQPANDRSGQAYVFRRDPATGAWAEAARLGPATLNPLYGRSVAAEGGTVAVNGLVELWFYRADAGWAETGRVRYYPNLGLIGGYAGPALSGNRVLLGDDENTAKGEQAGAAVVLTVPEAWTPDEPGPPSETAPGALAVAVRPNPARARVEVAVSLAEAGPARVVVLDALGREVAVVLGGEATAGERVVVLDTSQWPAGVYVVRASAGASVASARLVVAR